MNTFFRLESILKVSKDVRKPRISQNERKKWQRKLANETASQIISSPHKTCERSLRLWFRLILTKCETHRSSQSGRHDGRRGYKAIPLLVHLFKSHKPQLHLNSLASLGTWIAGIMPLLATIQFLIPGQLWLWPLEFCMKKLLLNRITASLLIILSNWGVVEKDDR